MFFEIPFTLKGLINTLVSLLFYRFFHSLIFGMIMIKDKDWRR